MTDKIPRNWRGIELLSSGDIAVFLLRKNWQQIPHNNARLRVMIAPDQSTVVALPALKTSDYYARLYEAVDRIAEIEDEPTYLVLQRFTRNKDNDRCGACRNEYVPGPGYYEPGEYGYCSNCCQYW